MPAYVLVALTITDAKLYEEYGKKARESSAPFAAKILVVDDEFRRIEGNLPAQRVVLMEFPSASDASAWYSSQKYAEATALRHQSTKTDLFLLLHGMS
jgi:uncharacterized protein (DUF1330 family)